MCVVCERACVFAWCMSVCVCGVCVWCVCGVGVCDVCVGVVGVLAYYVYMQLHLQNML